MERALLSVTLPLQYLSLPPSHSHSLKPLFSQLFSLSKFSFSLSHPLSLYVSHSLSQPLTLSLTPPPSLSHSLNPFLVFHSPLFPCLASYYHGSSSCLLSFSSSVGWMYVFPVDPLTLYFLSSIISLKHLCWTLDSDFHLRGLYQFADQNFCLSFTTRN